MSITVSHVFITVHDQDVALAFYRDVLGLEVRTDAPFDTFRWLTLGSPEQPDVEVVLEIPEMGREAHGAQLRELMSKGVLSGTLFRVSDLDVAFERVRASGAEILQEPTDMPYGVRDCAFRDPSGNHIRFSQTAA